MPRRYWLLGVIALFAFASLLLIRGPLTNPTPSGDFVHFYTAARAWMYGENPYAAATLQRVVEEAPGAPSHDHRPVRLIALYPPAMYPLISPWAVLPYQSAALAWTLMNLALVPVLIGLAAKLADVRLRSFSTLLIAVGVLALAPLQTTFRLGQMALLVTTLVVTALVLMHRDRQRWGGLMLGLAMALKPQIGAVFLAYAVIRKRWWTAGVGLATGLVCQGIGMAVLTAHGHDWLTDLRANVHAFAHGGPGDPTPANPSYWQLINLHHPLHQFIDSRSLVQALSWGLILAMGLAGWRAATPAGRRGRELLFLSLIAVLSLLVTYHRVYDAVVLVIPVVWLVHGGLTTRAGWGIAALLLPFVISGPAAMQQAAAAGWLPPAVEASWLWTTVLLPHQSWALLAAAGVMLWHLIATHPSPGRPSGDGSGR